MSFSTSEVGLVLLIGMKISLVEKFLVFKCYLQEVFNER